MTTPFLLLSVLTYLLNTRVTVLRVMAFRVTRDVELRDTLRVAALTPPGGASHSERLSRNVAFLSHQVRHAS